LSDDVVSADPARPPPTLTIPIDPPITFNGGTYSSLTLREPTVGQKRVASEQTRHGASIPAVNLYEIHFISGVSGVPVPVVERLPVTILNRAMSYIDFFLQDGRQTGWS
jgi:hypothetical protein